MIKGKRIILKLFENVSEIQKFTELYNDIDQRSNFDHTEVASMFRRIDDFNSVKLWSHKLGTMMILDEHNNFIGTIGYVRTSEFELNIGYRLLQVNSRNKGYMTEALQLFSEYLFDSIPGIVRLSLHTASNNEPSKRLAEKSGFQYEGTLRKAYFYRGKIHDQDIYSIIKE